MLVRRLLDHFDTYTRLHIDVNDVRDQLVSLGVQDQITFNFVSMDATKIRGIIYRYIKRNVPYAEPERCAHIIIASDMGEEDEHWKRLVAVKELVHITDCENLSAQSEEAVKNLLKNLSIPPELRREGQNGHAGTKSFINDRVRIFIALAILVPQGCRELLRPLYKNRLYDRDIAEIAKIPTRYVSVVMSDQFEEAIASFLDWEEDEQ